jgi:S1-C subfamily serine protease
MGTPVPSLAPFSFYPNAVAGALLAPVSEGLGKKLGVSTGVLVVTVPVGSPFAESGFEEGDVLIKIGDVVVRAVRDVSRAVGLANGNGQKSVDVVLMRDNKTLTKTLRW